MCTLYSSCALPPVRSRQRKRAPHILTFHIVLGQWAVHPEIYVGSHFLMPVAHDSRANATCATTHRRAVHLRRATQGPTANISVHTTYIVSPSISIFFDPLQGDTTALPSGRPVWFPSSSSSRSRSPARRCTADQKMSETHTRCKEKGTYEARGVDGTIAT